MFIESTHSSLLNLCVCSKKECYEVHHGEGDEERKNYEQRLERLKSIQPTYC